MPAAKKVPVPKYTKFLGPLSTYRRKVPGEGSLTDKAVGMSFDYSEQRPVFPKKLGANFVGDRTCNDTGTAAHARVGSLATPKDNKLG